MLKSELQLFEGLPVRFGCAGEKNPNRAFEKFVTRLVLETLSLSGYEVVSQFPKKVWFGNNGDSREIRPDIIVKSVIVILIASSIYSWAIIIEKIRLFKRINLSTEEFCNLSNCYDEMSKI